MARPWRKIVRRDTSAEERASISRRTFSWSSTDVHKLTLECGHVQTRRGMDPPKTKVICKDCERGKAPVEVMVEPGVSDRSFGPPKNLMANALIEGAREKAKRDG